MTAFSEQARDPFTLFVHLFHSHYTTSSLKHRGACVLSTIGLDGYPNARTVALKEMHHPDLIITGPTNGQKGQEIAANSKVALTFWWEEKQQQIRIQGVASQITKEEANFYFSERSKPSQVVSALCEQGSHIESREVLERNFQSKMNELKDKKVTRPDHWGGYRITPERYEFMEFHENRLHHRVLYVKQDSEWSRSVLQP